MENLLIQFGTISDPFQNQKERVIFLVGGNGPQHSMVVETTTLALPRPIGGVAVLTTRGDIVLGVLRTVLVAVGVTVVQDAGTVVDRTFRSARIADAGTMVSVS